MTTTDLDKELKMAEIDNIKAQTARITMEAEQLRATTLRLQAETAKIHAESQKVNAESQKILKETKFYPYVVAGGLGGLVGAIISLLIKAL